MCTVIDSLKEEKANEQSLKITNSKLEKQLEIMEKSNDSVGKCIEEIYEEVIIRRTCDS